MGEEGNQSSYKLVQEVVTVWKQDPELCKRGTTGKLANVGNAKSLMRKDVDVNATLLEPILIHFGTLAALEPINMMNKSTNPLSNQLNCWASHDLWFYCQGLRPSLGLLTELCQDFLVCCRPRGKPLPTSDWPLDWGIWHDTEWKIFIWENLRWHKINLIWSI